MPSAPATLGPQRPPTGSPVSPTPLPRRTLHDDGQICQIGGHIGRYAWTEGKASADVCSRTHGRVGHQPESMAQKPDPCWERNTDAWPHRVPFSWGYKRLSGGYNVPRTWCLFWDTKKFWDAKNFFKTFYGTQKTFFFEYRGFFRVVKRKMLTNIQKHHDYNNTKIISEKHVVFFKKNKKEIKNQSFFFSFLFFFDDFVPFLNVYFSFVHIFHGPPCAEAPPQDTPPPDTQPRTPVRRTAQNFALCALSLGVFS